MFYINRKSEGGRKSEYSNGVRCNNKRASITVMMSLLIAVIIGFIMIMTEHVRLLGLNHRLTEAADSAMDSLFSMYDSELFEEFGLMLLNIDELEDNKDPKIVLREYLILNLNSRKNNMFMYGNLYNGEDSSAEIEDMVFVTENEGELFARSVLEFMKYRTIGVALDTVNEQLNDIKAGEETKKEADEGQKKADEDLKERLSAVETDKKSEYEEAIKESWIDKIEQIRTEGWLSFVMPFEQAASTYIVDDISLPSRWRTTNLTWYHSAVSEMEEKLLFNEYLMEHCRSFSSVKASKGMSYEIEYVLNGGVSDKENLKMTVNSMLMLREMMNLMSAIKSPLLSAQAETAASALVGWTGIYPVVKVTQIAMLTGWSFAEAIIDVRTLLGGGRIPLIKSEENWELSIDQMADFIEKDNRMIAENEEGLVYDDYLKLLLYMLDRNDRRYRTMDVIQLRMKEKNPEFLMEDCVGAIQAEFNMKASPLFYSFGSRYRFSYRQSRMY